MAETKNPFEYQRPSSEHVEQIETVRAALKQTHDTVLASVPPSRERSLAITKLEEASMWANKGIVFNDAVAKAGSAVGQAGEQQPQAVATRAKFRVSSRGSSSVGLAPVYDNNPETENGRFFAATPGGSISMSGLRPEVAEQFKLGQAFYIDFIPAAD